MKIQLFGPYRLVDTLQSRQSFPDFEYFERAPQAALRGVYLQGVRLSARYRVGYVGETGDSFSSRICSENRDCISLKDTAKRQCTPRGYLELDPELYRDGIRDYRVLLTEQTERKRLRQIVLDETVIFLAPLQMEAELNERKNIEAAIVRRLKACDLKTADFLYNCPDKLRNRRFNGTLIVKMPAGLQIEGLDVPFSDLC